MRGRFLVSLVVGGVALSSCTSSSTVECSDSVVTRVDPSFDGSVLQTFAVLDADTIESNLPDDLPDDTIAGLDAANDAVRSELLSRGLSEVDADEGDPDVVVFSVAASESTDGVVWSCVGGWVWYGYWGYVWDPCAWLTPIQVEYDVGTVVVGLADPEAREAVFGGAIQGALVCENGASRIRKGVERIFEDYP